MPQITRNIQAILNDLYKIDSTLRNHEAEIVALITQLLQARPDTRFDQAFARRLRAQLLADALPQAQHVPVYNYTNFITMFTMKKISYAAAGVAVVVLAMVVWQGLKPTERTRLAVVPHVTPVGSEAFGSLLQETAEIVALGSVENAASPTTDNYAKRSALAGVGAGGGGGDMMIAPGVAVRYVYGGEPLSIEDDMITVLRRVQDRSAAGALGAQLRGFDFGDFSLANFSALAVQNITFVEDRDFGYMINFNPWEGVLSINQNWERWPQWGAQCAPNDGVCFESLQLTVADLPADEVLTSIADAFIRERAIDVSAYGTPYVDRSWISADTVFIGDQLSVVYPLVIDGQQVIEEGGQPSGITVSVDIRNRRVAGVWNYQTLQFESSDYVGETDAARLIRFAEQGGRYRQVYYADSNAEQISVTLGTPETSLVKIWRHSNTGAPATELLVPALVFPLLDKPANTPPWIQRVVVPLARELLDEADRESQGVSEPPIGIPRPLPLTTEDEVVAYPEADR